MTQPPMSSSALTRQAGIYVILGGVAVAAIAIGLAVASELSPGFTPAALAVYFAVGVFAVARIADHHPHGRFGTANALTLIRLILTALMGGLAFEVAFHEFAPSPWMAWLFCALAVAALIIDGLDGYVARRENLVSDFGGRFDMEVDALQILLLCIVAVTLGKAGLWVLIGGALRYAYEVAGVFWPALQRPLPPSFRRKLMSVIEGGTLAGLLAPIIVPPVSTVAAAAALALLIYSFAVDVIWLAADDRRARRGVS
jgi:phosphatidylglycerophosphate synthase